MGDTDTDPAAQNWSIHDRVTQPIDAAREKVRVLLDSRRDVIDRLRWSTVDRHEELGAEKEAEIERLKVVGIGRRLVEPDADDDHEQVAGKLLELRSAVHGERVFHGERMEPGDGFQQIDLRRIADVDVDPDMTVLRGDRLVDFVERQAAPRFAGAVQVVAARMNEIGHRGDRGKRRHDRAGMAGGSM